MSASAKDAAHAPGYGFGVYVHWPFCQAKCPYCDFNSHVWAEIDQARWGAALIQELAAMSLRTGPRAVDSVFFGGGTPSLMTPQTVSDLIEAIDDLWGLRAGAEITLEANPTSVEAEKFQGYRAAGVNRLSMGVQALNDADLKALGRLHTVREALAAFEIARAAFDRVSFDLIYARMGQTSQAWAAELDQALALAVDHLSLYQLTLEPGTPFHALAERGKLHTPPDDAAAEMFEITQTRCAAQGLPAYEISNHARPGAESRHNLVYWRMGDYVGAGPGAHGRLTTAPPRRRATETIRDPARMARPSRRARRRALERRDDLASRSSGRTHGDGLTVDGKGSRRRGSSIWPADRSTLQDWPTSKPTACCVRPMAA